jgi:hypothetical protein
MRRFTRLMYLTHLTRGPPLTSLSTVGPSLFDPLPPIAADEDITLAAAHDQAELM